MTPTDEWLKACRELREKFSDNILSDDYLKAKVEQSTFFIEKYPVLFGDPKMVGRGTPRAVLQESSKRLAEFNKK